MQHCQPSKTLQHMTLVLCGLANACIAITSVKQSWHLSLLKDKLTVRFAAPAPAAAELHDSLPAAAEVF